MFVLFKIQDVLSSEVLATHSALVNADLCRELVSVTQQLEEFKIQHKLVKTSFVVRFCTSTSNHSKTILKIVAYFFNEILARGCHPNSLFKDMLVHTSRRFHFDGP